MERVPNKEILWIKDSGDAGNYLRVFTSRSHYQEEFMMAGIKTNYSITNGVLIISCNDTEADTYYMGGEVIEFWDALTAYVTPEYIMFSHKNNLYKIPYADYITKSYVISSSDSLKRKRFLPVHTAKGYTVEEGV